VTVTPGSWTRADSAYPKDGGGRPATDTDANAHAESAMTDLMITIQRSILALAGAVLLAACASGPPKPEVDYKSDYNFSQVRKIAFYDDSGLISGNNPIPLSDMERDRIDLALEQALRNKGYQLLDEKDADQADLLISWTLITNAKTDVRTYETPVMGMTAGSGRYGGYNRYSMYNCWGCTQTEVSVQNYTEGTFIVDMIDPKLRKSVWRGLIQSRLKGKLESDQDKYNAVADSIFASFPPP
jgi:hypothetical protein